MKFTKVKKVESRGANVNRIYKHLQEHCVCFITAFRQIYDIAENNKRIRRAPCFHKPADIL